ncbi:anthranilate phosphoribosyltransferase [Candidatus Sumerlaeota bacterium]|nr:anthranilate phosphoribosyltransferase [Candidatus Sumerlaeota bacterium]
MIKDVIAKLADNEEITSEECKSVANEILGGEATPCQIAGFITALRCRGEQIEHIVPFVEVMREKMEPFNSPDGVILDIVGTGGDCTGTFNISTTAAIIAAGAGVRVAKHGNRAVSSSCGAADVLKALGVNTEAPIAVQEKCLEEIGLCFLFAPVFHSAMKHAVQPRKELGIRTIFNMIGPLCNPAQATNYVVGVYSNTLTETFARVLGELGCERALVVHGSDGMDEFTTTTTTTVAELDGDTIETHVYDPGDFDLSPANMQELLGGDAETNAEIVRGVLTGQWGETTDIAVLNAGAAIYAAGAAESIREGMSIARKSIESGAAMEKIEALSEMTNQ